MNGFRFFTEAVAPKVDQFKTLDLDDFILLQKKEPLNKVVQSPSEIT